MPAPAPATAATTSPAARPRSAEAYARAKQLMPGGVSSPVRAYKAVGGDPVFVREGHGARVVDLDGNEYIDYVLSYGPLILGHAPEPVSAAIVSAATRGTSFGMPTEAEATLAQLIIDAVPSIEKVRFVNSGTEATMSALRLARAATGKPRIIKFSGCYHGHTDGLLVDAGSGATTLGIPSSPGVPQAMAELTLVLPLNDLSAVEQALSQHADIAAVIIEPIAGNMGLVLPVEGYLEGLRSLCTKHGVILIFDEVMTGFRVSLGGAQELLGVTPDLTCLGKIVGGGLPCAAYGGRADLMRHIAPEGAVYQAGTLSGNPLAMAAGIAMLEALQDRKAYEALEQAGAKLASGLEAAAKAEGVALTCTRVGSMICPFFHPGPVQSYAQALKSDTKAFATFFRAMLARGVMLPPSQFETWFLSTQHDDRTIAQTLTAARHALAAVARGET